MRRPPPPHPRMTAIDTNHPQHSSFRARTTGVIDPVCAPPRFSPPCQCRPRMPPQWSPRRSARGSVRPCESEPSHGPGDGYSLALRSHSAHLAARQTRLLVLS